MNRDNPHERLELLDWQSMIALFEGWAERYCAHPSYFRIGGRPVCSFLNLGDFVNTYGLDGFQLIIQTARQIMQRRLGQDPFVIGVFGEATLKHCALANLTSIDGATGYGLLPEWTGPPVQHYAELIPRRTAEWAMVQRHLRVPFFPVVCAGWDATVRGEWAADLRNCRGFPWRPVVDGVNAELFGHFVDAAVAFNLAHHPELNVVYVHAWNEWTESSAIEPSDRFGDQFLRQLAQRTRPMPLEPTPNLPLNGANYRDIST